jgi:putative membrane protein
MREIAVRSIALIAMLITSVSIAIAHDGHDHAASVFDDLEFSQVLTSLGLLVSLTVYSVGLFRLWQHAGRGHGITVAAAVSFFVGWASLAGALIGPFHALSETLFSAHMTQHEILMLVSAPLIILGRPQIAAVWALPIRWRNHVSDITNNAAFENIWRFISGTFVAFMIHAGALWIWHIPTLFDATLASDLVHALQHASFFGTALLFWWAIVNASRDWKSSFVGVLFLFLTSLHSGILGALLTFTREIWYAAYLNTTSVWGLTPFEDQQLGGLIMWVPAGLVYIGAGLAMFARVLSQTEKRALDIDKQFLGEGIA